MDFNISLMTQCDIVLKKHKNLSTTQRNTKLFNTSMCAKTHCA